MYPDSRYVPGSSIRCLQICTSGLKCSCDLERDLYVLRPAVNFQRCTQCFNNIAWVRMGDLGSLAPFREFERAFWSTIDPR